MKDYELLDVIGGIDEKFVLLASDEKPAKRAVVLKFAILAAAIVVVAVTAFAITLGVRRPTAAPVVPTAATESGTEPFSGTEPIATFEDNMDTESDTETEEGTETDPVPISSEDGTDPEPSDEPSGDVSVIDDPTPVTPPDSASENQPNPDNQPQKTESQSTEKDPTPQTETDTETETETSDGGSQGGSPFPPLYYRSLDDALSDLKSMDQGTLDYIAEYEDRTDRKYYRSEKEKQNGVFNEFRNRILTDGKIRVPLIDGKELTGDENRDENVCIFVSNACARPWISFLNDLVEVRLTYLDDDIAEEANAKGCSWLKEKLEPGSRNTYNYLEYREKYIAEGWGQLATITVTEVPVTFDGKETKALVSSYLNGTLDREVVTVWVVSGNTLAAVGGFPEDVWDAIARMTFTDHRFD